MAELMGVDGGGGTVSASVSVCCRGAAGGIRTCSSAIGQKNRQTKQKMSVLLQLLLLWKLFFRGKRSSWSQRCVMGLL